MRFGRILETLGNASSLTVSIVFQAIPPFEFAFKDERISLTIVDAVISPPTVPKGTICKELKVYPAECRGRRSTYRGKLTVSTSENVFLLTSLKIGLIPNKVYLRILLA
jgi:DNA-directed RNA polymerase I subunit RPA2